MTEIPAAVGLYVPAPDTPLRHRIDHGSGVVATSTVYWQHGCTHQPWVDDIHVVDFEGNRYNASNIITYYDRVAHAAGRHFASFPTVARVRAPEDELIHVGWYYPHAKQIEVLATDRALMTLIAWLTVDEQSPNLHVEVRPGTAVLV